MIMLTRFHATLNWQIEICMPFNETMLIKSPIHVKTDLDNFK